MNDIIGMNCPQLLRHFPAAPPAPVLLGLAQVNDIDMFTPKQLAETGQKMLQGLARPK